MQSLTKPMPASRRVTFTDPSHDPLTEPVPVFDQLLAEEMREALRPAPEPKLIDRSTRREPYQFD